MSKKSDAIYKYSATAFKAYVWSSGISSIIIGFAIGFISIKSITFINLCRITYYLFFKHLSLVLAVGTVEIAMDVSQLEAINKHNKDFGIIDMFCQNDIKIKIEVISGIVGFNMIILVAFIQEWIDDFFGQLITVPDYIIMILLIIGCLLIINKFIFIYFRKRKYK